MTRRIQITLLSLLMSVCAMASNTSVKNSDGVDIWYDFDSSTNTASVTYKGSNYYSYKNEYPRNVVIPSTVTYEGVEYSVTSIGDYAFRNCSALTSITIPEGVTSIGDYAFDYCSALTSITLPEGVTSIGDYAFDLCYSLTSITLPEGVTSIGDNAFYRCSALTSITLPEGLTSIGNRAFGLCKALTSVAIPSSMPSFGFAVFDGCDLNILTKLYYGGTIVDWCSYEFESWDINPLCYVRHLYIDGDEVKDLIIPKEVTSIGKFLFRSCHGLISVMIDDSVTEIGYGAFYECYGLKSVTIGKGVTSIGERAFYSCSALTSITSKNATPPTIGDSYTFYDVDKSIPVYVPKSSVDAYKSAEYWKDFTNVIGKYYIVDIEAENGTVEGAGAYEENAEATLTVTPAEGYKFVKWSDGVTDNPRTVVVVSDMTFTAEFDLKEYTLTTEAENGSIAGAGTYKHGAEATLTATPAEGYKFVQWSDGVTDNPRTVEVTSDLALTAEFELKEYTLTTEAENGTVEGAGTYKHGDEATLTATPAEGYKFVQWSDGVTDNPRTVVVTSDTTFTAMFVLKEYTLTTEAENGTVEGAGTYKHGTEATLTATPAEGYKFVQWSDGVTDNPRTVVVVSDMTFTAEFELKEYTLTTEAENGTVKGAGTYKHGAEATLTVTPAEGYKFVKWSDGVTDIPRTIEVTSDLTLTAEFEIDVTPISDIQTSDVNVRLIGNEIVVEGADDYTVYSINGQNLGKVERVERGIYIVVVNGKSYKVIAK